MLYRGLPQATPSGGAKYYGVSQFTLKEKSFEDDRKPKISIEARSANVIKSTTLVPHKLMKEVGAGG